MKVRLENAQGYLAVSAAGRFCLDVMYALIDCIAEEAKKPQVTRVLVDVSRMHGDASITERYQYITYAAPLLARLERCAAFAGEGQRVVQFSEIAAQNRGFNLRVFKERAQAVQWLLAGTGGFEVLGEAGAALRA